MGQNETDAALPPRTQPTATRAALLAKLEALGIAAVTHEHQAVFTVGESTGIKDDLPGGHSKNLFVKDKKGALFLISAKQDTEVALKSLHRALGCGRLSFGSADLLWEALGVTPGSVTALAAINDPEARVQIVLDTALMACDPVNFHPLENTATTALSPQGLMRFLEAVGHAPIALDVSADTPACGAASPPG